MDWRDDLHFIAWKAICERREGTDEELRMIQQERSVYRGPNYIDRCVKLHDPFRKGDLELQIRVIEQEYLLNSGDSVVTGNSVTTPTLQEQAKWAS